MKHYDQCMDSHSTPASREEGFALVVSVIFLGILTALGINAMRTSALEEKMAANTEQQSFAFQSAETGLTIGFSTAPSATTSQTLDNAKKQYQIVNGAVTELGDNCNRNPAGAKTVNLCMSVGYKIEGKVPPAGHSLDGPFATHHFSMMSEARYGTTRTELHQGFRRLGPSGDQ